MKKYSESKIQNAQRFLADYNLTFESLDAKQKDAVVNFTFSKKYLTLCLVVLFLGLAVFISGAYLFHSRSLTIFDNVSAASESGETINLHKYGKLCLVRGFMVGVFACAAFFTLINLLNLPFLLKVQSKIFNAFLPPLKQHSSDNEISSK